MPVAFIFFIIAFLLAAIATPVWLRLRSSEVNRSNGDSAIAGFVVLVLGIIAGGLLLLCSFTIVPANEVGIVTQFGRWGKTVDSGFHLVEPWSSVDTFPTRNQKSIRDEGQEGEAGCVPVKLKGDASACVDLTVLYTIDETNAETLWRGWGSFDKLNKDLIERSTDDAVNAILSTYPPEQLTANRAKITDDTTDKLAERLRPQGVRLESITFGTAHFTDKVQQRIDSILEADANVLVAQKEKERAVALAEAAKARQIGLTPEALIVACLDAAKEIKPQIFDCGLGGLKQQPSVIVGPR